MTHTVGIDLGTTNSAVARIVGEDPTVLPTDSGDRTLPSVVAFETDGTVRVGRQAVNLAAQYPERVIESVKRRMGENEPIAHVNGEAYLPEEVSALILRKLKEIAESELGSPVTNAVITVPAYFDNEQREATKRAGEIAGLSVDRILNEPTAAMLAHGVRRRDDTVGLVYDLGGGTFDVSVVKAAKGVFEVEATDGLRNHGGDDWDARLVGQIKEMIESDTGRSLDEQTMHRIWDAAREAKEDLASRKRTTVSIPFVFQNYDFEETITREDFDAMTNDLLEETIDVCHDVLKEGDITSDDIDEVLLVGGSTRMPQITERLEEAFGDRVQRSGSPDEVVAEGAAIQAGLVSDSLPVVKESGSDQLKSREEHALDTVDEDDGTYDLPEVYDDVVLVDVTSKSLGKSVVGDNFVKMIRRNTPIPAERTERFQTTEDDQTMIRIEVYQGESMTASENRLLDEFVFSGLPRLPAGEAKIDVTFRIDEDGILDVTAQSVQKGHADNIEIDSGIEYDEEEIEEMRASLPDIK